MSEMGDHFNALRQERQEKRANNREKSAAMLRQNGVLFEAKNFGAHLVVTAGPQTVDFWPGTGLWRVRGASIERRGVRRLIGYVTEQRAARNQTNTKD